MLAVPVRERPRTITRMGFLRSHSSESINRPPPIVKLFSGNRLLKQFLGAAVRLETSCECAGTGGERRYACCGYQRPSERQWNERNLFRKAARVGANYYSDGWSRGAAQAGRSYASG